jgi:hypothetical protein
MHNLPTDFLAACVGILAVLQGLSILLTHLGTAAKQIEGRSTWVAHDGTVFEEYALTEIEGSQVMLHDFEDTLGEQLLSIPLRIQANG